MAGPKKSCPPGCHQAPLVHWDAYQALLVHWDAYQAPLGHWDAYQARSV